MDAPVAFENQSLDALYIRNNSQYLIILMITLSSYILIRLLKKFAEVENLSNLKRLMVKFVNFYEFGLFLGPFECSFLNFLLFSLL